MNFNFLNDNVGVLLAVIVAIQVWQLAKTAALVAGMIEILKRTEFMTQRTTEMDVETIKTQLAEMTECLNEISFNTNDKAKSTFLRDRDQPSD